MDHVTIHKVEFTDGNHIWEGYGHTPARAFFHAWDWRITSIIDDLTEQEMPKLQALMNQPTVLIKARDEQGVQIPGWAYISTRKRVLKGLEVWTALFEDQYMEYISTSFGVGLTCAEAVLDAWDSRTYTVMHLLKQGQVLI